MLCTRQYSVHCVSTFFRPRSVNRSRRLLCRRFPIQALGALPGFLGEVGFDRLAVVLAVTRQRLARCSFEFVGLMSEVGPRAALGLGGVAGQFDAVDGEHFPTDQALPVAEVEDLYKELGNFLALSSSSGLNLVIPYGSRHDAGMKTLFLQRR